MKPILAETDWAAAWQKYPVDAKNGFPAWNVEYVEISLKCQTYLPREYTTSRCRYWSVKVLLYPPRVNMIPQVLKKMQYQIPKSEVDAVVQCKAGAIEKVRVCGVWCVHGCNR